MQNLEVAIPFYTFMKKGLTPCNTANHGNETIKMETFSSTSE